MTRLRGGLRARNSKLRADHPQAQIQHTFLTETEAANLLALSVKTLRQWRWAGIGPVHYKFGKAVRYSESDLQEYIASSQRKSTSDLGA